MTLARRMTLEIVGLAVSLTALGGVTVRGLVVVRRAAEVARDEYIELRLVLELNEHLFAARERLHAPEGLPEAHRQLDVARERLAEFRRFQATQHRDKTHHEEDEDELLTLIDGDLQETLDRPMKAGNRPDFDTASVFATLDRAQSHIAQLSTETDERISQSQIRLDRVINRLLAVLGSACALIIIATVVVNVAQYRSIIMPLRRLSAGVRRVSTGRLDERVDGVPEGEFADVAGDFNQMASKLHDLYETLENRVREQSRECVRSERLASVGYLAAGVAHEINNPLGIITGYAEVTLKRLQRNGLGGKGVNAEEALRAIRDEAFRCKDITDKLLSLAGGREVVRKPIVLRHIIDDVVSILGTLPKYRDRTLDAHVDGAERLEIIGNETELRQVILNLAINALESVQPAVGEVRFDGRRRNGVVELVVSDNGRGMAPDTLEHIFEPFFTHRSDGTAPGTGLGLSITHAIIEAHGGRIRAESDGPNRGSRFFIELPAINGEEGK